VTYAWIYFDGILRGTFDPGSTEFLRFFDLYPKEGGLLTVAIDKGRIATIKALYANPLLFWSTAVMLPILLIYLSSACITLCNRAIQDPSIVALSLIAAYYMVIAGGPGDWGRFRHPVMPIICVLGGYGLCAVWSRLSRYFLKRLAYAHIERISVRVRSNIRTTTACIIRAHASNAALHAER